MSYVGKGARRGAKLGLPSTALEESRHCRRGRRRSRVVARLALALVVAALMGMSHLAGVAQAGSYLADLCATSSGTAVGSAGLTESTTGPAPVYFFTHEHSCNGAGQQITMHLGPYGNGYADEQGGIYYYTTPAGVTISSYRMAIAAYAGSCLELTGTSCLGGVGQVFVAHTGEIDPEYDFRDLGDGDLPAATIERNGLERVDQLWVGVSCDGLAGRCVASKAIAGVTIPWAQFTLKDATVPKVAVVGAPGDLASTVSGEAEWAFEASDSGSGIYAVGAEVDGQMAKEEQLDEGGDCRNMAISGMRTFNSPQPCALAVDTSLSLDTNALADGSHRLRLYVEDAAGDRADFFDGTLVTQNGPILEGRPAISGVAEVGAPLTATNGTFKSRSGDSLSSLTGQWQRCTDLTNCEPIAGATSTSYVPTSADAGHELVYTDTATAVVDEGTGKGLAHSTTASSVPSLPVEEASGSGPACVEACVPGAPGIGGTGASGGNGGGGTSGITVDIGSVRVLPGGGSGLLGNASSWKVSLSVSPKQVRRHTTIHLKGVIATAPRPAPGKLVYLEARSLQVSHSWLRGRWRRIQSYGGWITFMVLRARPDGTFATTYRFRLGGRHTYEFRAVAPAEGQFRNTTGQSRIVMVKER